jgi:ribosomal protein S18 acetylase RimI-like enzyme
MIHYQRGTHGIDAGWLDGYFVGWSDPPSPERHLKILNGSSIAILAIDDEHRRVAGFITAITDGSLAAYIPLLEVLPEYQGRGIGSELVRRMLAELDGYYMIDVSCDADVQPFYARFGLHPWTAMIHRGRIDSTPVLKKGGRG